MRSGRITARALVAAGAALLTLASVSTAPAQHIARLDPPGAPLAIPLIPTQTGFGMSIPALAPPPNGVRSGSLVCSRDSSRCLQTGIDALDQNDSAVHARLQTYITATYGASAAWSEPQLGIAPETTSAEQFATDVEYRGCHIATITMLENAALTELAPAARTSGRVTAFVSAKPPGANTLRIGRRRLLWQYERWTDTLQPNATTRDALRPGFLDLPEFTAGIAGASYKDYAAPSLETASDARIERLVRAGHHLGFAYTRWIVGRAYDSFTTAAFTLATQHAVAVVGFDASQRYPVSIADVGTGTYYRVRIARLRDLAFVVHGGAVLPLTMPAGTPVAAPDPAYADRLAVLYEGVPPDETFVQPMEVNMLDAVMDLTVPARARS